MVSSKFIKVVFPDGLFVYVDSDKNIYSSNYRLLTKKINNMGYEYVSVRGTDKKQHSRFVHRILVKAFVFPDLDDSYEVHHIDRNPLNNDLSNLQPMLRSDHRIEHQQIYPLTKICEVCGKEFTPHKTKRRRAHVCSEECKHKLDFVHAALRKRKILQCLKSGEVVCCWDSARDVQNSFGFHESNINKCCNGNIRSAYGYVWKYAE